MTEYEVLNDHWYQLSNYSNPVCVGIVKIKINDQIKGYIGTASGLDRE